MQMEKSIWAKFIKKREDPKTWQERIEMIAKKRDKEMWEIHQLIQNKIGVLEEGPSKWPGYPNHLTPIRVDGLMEICPAYNVVWSWIHDINKDISK